MNKIILAAFLLAGLAVRANDNEPNKDHTGSASTAEVSYVGNQEGEPLFNVMYNNSTGARFSIRVMDSEGRQIYQGVFKERKFNKKFKVTNADNYGKLVFVIRNFQDDSQQRFEVNSNTRVVEDILVKEVK